MFPRWTYGIIGARDGTGDTDELKSAGEIQRRSNATPGNATAAAFRSGASENVYNMVYKSSEQGREYQGTLEDATARSLHHAGARSIGAVVSATRVRLPVVQRAPVDGRVDEIGAPLQQSASDAVRHHLGGQRERLQKLFPPPSIRIQVKASTCQAQRANQASSGSHLVPRCRGDPQSRRCPSTQSDVIRGNQTSSKGVPRRSSTTSMPIRSHQRDARSTARACSTAESRARSTSSSKPDRAA